MYCIYFHQHPFCCGWQFVICCIRLYRHNFLLFRHIYAKHTNRYAQQLSPVIYKVKIKIIQHNNPAPNNGMSSSRHSLFFLTVIFNLKCWYFYIEKKKNNNFTSLSQYKMLWSNIVSWFDLFIKCKYEAFVRIPTCIFILKISTSA